MQKVVVLALEGVFDSSLSLTLDALATANRLSRLSEGSEIFAFDLFLPGQRTVSTRNGGQYAARSRLPRGPKAALVVPGLGLATEQEIDAFLASDQARRVLRWLGTHAASFPIVCASCSSTFLLAEAGLLDGHAATTTWWLAPVFRARYPNVALDERRMVTESGRFLCAGAALAQMDLMLHLIARLAGPELATRIARTLIIEQRPTQSRYMISSALAGLNGDVARAEHWVRERLDTPFTVADMARELGMSPRTLDRRLRTAVGVGPSKFVQRLRSEQAVHLIETTDLSIEEVTTRVGYANTASLRRVLRRERDASPSELRASLVGRA